MARLTRQGQLLHDVTVRFQVYLERLKAGQARALDPAMRAMDVAVRRALEGATGTPSQRQLTAMLGGLRVELAQAVAIQEGAYFATLRRFSTYAADYHLATLGLVLPASAPALTSVSAALAWARILEAPIQATGELLQPFTQNWGESAIKRIEGAIRSGFAQGKTAYDIIRAVRGTKAAAFSDGLLGGVTKREANAMVRTALQHVSNAAQQTVNEANSDILDGYIWISTLDSRTSSTCQSLDGQEFKLGKGPVPPIHINCRSTTIPKIKGVDLLAVTTRASKGDEGGQQVPAEQTFYTWLKTQSASFQDDALGPTRATLFRNGGLSAEQFATLNLDKNFQPLTLDEMRQKNPSAFKRAGI